MHNRFSWRRADVALAWLVLLATLVAWLALTFSASGFESALALVATVCLRTLDEALAHSADLGRLSLLLPLGLGLCLATVEALQLILATRRLITTLHQARCTSTPGLRRVVTRCGLPDVTLVRTDRPLVFTQGLVKPHIWLSTGLMQVLSDDELEAVLRHEAHHRQARDPLKIFVARCLSRALFFVPIARDLCEAYCVTKEIAADAQATQAMSDALPLARALRKLIAYPATPAPVAAMTGEGHIVEARLLALLDLSQPIPFFPLKHLGISLVWLLVVLMVVLAPAAGHLPSFTECAPTTISAFARF